MLAGMSEIQKVSLRRMGVPMDWFVAADFNLNGGVMHELVSRKLFQRRQDPKNSERSQYRGLPLAHRVLARIKPPTES